MPHESRDAWLHLSICIAEISDRTLERFFRQFRNRGPGAGA